jgi:hypothetical protein
VGRFCSGLGGSGVEFILAASARTMARTCLAVVRGVLPGLASWSRGAEVFVRECRFPRSLLPPQAEGRLPGNSGRATATDGSRGTLSWLSPGLNSAVSWETAFGLGSLGGWGGSVRALAGRAGQEADFMPGGVCIDRGAQLPHRRNTDLRRNARIPCGLRPRSRVNQRKFSVVPQFENPKIETDTLVT